MSETLQLPEGVIADYSTEYSEEIRGAVGRVVSEYAMAGEHINIDPDHVREAMQPLRCNRETVVGEIDGIPFTSTRVCVGMPGNDRTFRGGFEWMALPEKVAAKAATMAAKQDMARTGDQGGKGALWVPPRYRQYITPEWRQKAVATHALMHDINGRYNATATDIGTSTADMNVMVDALYPYLGMAAQAAVSGADEAHGGIPDFQMGTTGKGASIVSDEYLQARQKYGARDDEIARKLRQGVPLRILQQAFGKAGAPFALNLPHGTELAGAMEYAGGIYDPIAALDPEEVVRLVRINGLAESSAADGQQWLPREDLRKFWQKDADILVPAFDRDQVDVDDLRDPSMVIVEIANGGVTTDANHRAEELGIDVLSGALVNMGATMASSKRGRMLLYGSYADMQQLQDSWQRDMHGIAQKTFHDMYKLRLAEGRYVSSEEIIFRTIAKRAIKRRDEVRRSAASKI